MGSPDKTPKKTFKEYYADPEFRQKHLDFLAEKITCECGFVTARSNIYRHRKSHIHIKKMEKINRIQELEAELEKLKKN